MHGHREEREQRAQHEGTGGDVAIVLMDSRAHGDQRAEGHDCAEPHAIVMGASSRQATRPTSNVLSPQG